MKHKERVLSALAWQGYDRLPVRYMGEPAVSDALMQHFGVSDYDELQIRLGEDLRYVQPVYCGPERRVFPDGTYESLFPGHAWPTPERYRDVPYGGGAYSEEAFRPFEDLQDVRQLSEYSFPTPDWFDYSQIKGECQQYAEYAIVTGSPGVLDFINGIAHSRGTEQVLIDIGLEHPVYLALVEKKFSFQYALIENTLKAAEGMIDIVHTGEDFAGQRGLLISPAKFEALFAPRYEEFFSMVHSYGARTMLHCCGSPRHLVPRLIELGVDILDVVQVSADNMDIRSLAAEFGGKLALCGSMDVQEFMPKATPEEVQREVALRQELFPDGGLIIGPSHNIQVDTPLENILALYDAAGSLERILAADQ